MRRSPLNITNKNTMHPITSPTPIPTNIVFFALFSLETIVTAILFSMIGYFNGHDKTVWVIIQGLTQTLLVRLPFAYYMSIQPDASLTKIGLAAPVATIFGIVLNVVFYIWCDRKDKAKHDG